MNDKLILGFALGFLLGSKSKKHPPSQIVPVGKKMPGAPITKRPVVIVKRPQIVSR